VKKIKVKKNQPTIRKKIHEVKKRVFEAEKAVRQKKYMFAAEKNYSPCNRACRTPCVQLHPLNGPPYSKEDAAVNRLANINHSIDLCQVTTSEIDAATKLLDM
jgi:hypothetical protein